MRIPCATLSLIESGDSMYAANSPTQHISTRATPVKAGKLVTLVPFALSEDGTYQYYPLQDQEIRLVKILSCPSPCVPGLQLHNINPRNTWGNETRYEDGEMHIRISHAKISDCYNDYTALSYCWGDPKERRVIFVHGLDRHDDEALIMSVTASLYGALQRAQHATIYGMDVVEQTSVSALFWADAICIRQDWNKDDTDEDEFWAAEKAEQVKMMATIYRNAITCLVDLGDDSADSHLIYDFALTIHKAAVRAWQEGRPHRDQHIKFSEMADYGFPLPEDPNWIAWTRFLARPWFRRVWVVQEYFLARPGAFMYGSSGKSLPWSFMPWMAYSLRCLGLDETHRRHSRSESVEDIGKAKRSESCLFNHSVWSSRKQHGWTPSLLDGFYNIGGMEATDLRDKAYSLLGMCAPLDLQDPDLRVDYSKTAMPDEVLFRFTRYIMRNDLDAVSVLYVCGGPTPGFPSWCPDWCHTQQRAMKQFRNRKQIFKAGGDSQCLVNFDSTTDSVLCRGFALDEIGQLGPTHTGSDIEFFTWERQARKWITRIWYRDCQQQGPLSNRYSTMLKFNDAYARALVGDNYLPAIEDHGSLYEKLMNIFDKVRHAFDQEVGNQITTLFDDMKSFETWDVAYRACIYRCHNVVSRRRLCLTRYGRLALVPARCRAGDKVVLLKGAVMPFVMRLKDPNTLTTGNKQPFELHGGSYVDGIMYSEASTDIERDKKWVDIMIQ